jgi:predicted esterase
MKASNWLFWSLISTCSLANAREETWPALPIRNEKLVIPAQEWPLRPGPRTVPIKIFYPGRELAKVNAQTGIMLTLHNWGGTGSMGTADPGTLAERYNVVAITVDYLESGPPKDWKEPYDFGYLQALDALRALYFVYGHLQAAGVPFDPGRIFATGGSGGGNVTLMCNKLAPRTFACIIEISGMAKLSDDLAFNLPGGSGLDAQYSRDPNSPSYLSPDAQQLRFVGDPDHLQVMRKLKNACKIVVLHGMGDETCPVADAQEMVNNLRQAKLDVDAHFITKEQIDGKMFTYIGHGMGNLTLMVDYAAGQYLSPASPKALRRAGKSDFDFHDQRVRYKTANGQFVISYAAGYPVGKFK